MTISPEEDLDAISQVVHEALRAYVKTIDQPALPTWSRAPKWMREATKASVIFVLENTKSGPGAQHDQWCETKKASGWTYGKKKDGRRKTHPMLVPFAELALEEQAKDNLVNAIVRALKRG